MDIFQRNNKEFSRKSFKLISRICAKVRGLTLASLTRSERVGRSKRSLFIFCLAFVECSIRLSIRVIKPLSINAADIVINRRSKITSSCRLGFRTWNLIADSSSLISLARYRKEIGVALGFSIVDN